MNWVRNNRFLSAYLAVLLVCGGALGFLLFNSLSRYEQVNSDYKTQVDELKRLQNLKPYPDAVSQKMYDTAAHDYSAAVTSLQADLASHEPPPAPPISPIQFQDRLRQTVDDITHFAQQSGVALPEGFYLGFDAYRSSPPDAAVAPLLNGQLDAVTDLVTILIKARVDKLSALRRAPLPQENPGAAAAAAAPGRPEAPVSTGANLTSKQTLEISFTPQPGSFRDALNTIVHNKRLFIIRALQVKNQSPTGPPRDEGANVPGGPGAPAASTPAPTAPGPDGVPNPPLPEKGAPLHYVVGQEKLDVTARLDLIRVQPPAVAAPRS